MSPGSVAAELALLPRAVAVRVAPRLAVGRRRRETGLHLISDGGVLELGLAQEPEEAAEAGGPLAHPGRDARPEPRPRPAPEHLVRREEVPRDAVRGGGLVAEQPRVPQDAQHDGVREEGAGDVARPQSRPRPRAEGGPLDRRPELRRGKFLPQPRQDLLREARLTPVGEERARVREMLVLRVRARRSRAGESATTELGSMPMRSNDQFPSALIKLTW